MKVTPNAVRYIDLSPGEQFRCAFWDRGMGTIVGRLELGEIVTGYDVVFDEGDGKRQRVLPADLKYRTVQPSAAMRTGTLTLVRCEQPGGDIWALPMEATA